MARLASRRIRQLVLNVLIVVDGVHGEIGRNGQVSRKRDGFGGRGASMPQERVIRAPAPSSRL
jgi:hypothetical protein